MIFFAASNILLRISEKQYHIGGSLYICRIEIFRNEIVFLSPVKIF